MKQLSFLITVSLLLFSSSWARAEWQGQTDCSYIQEPEAEPQHIVRLLIRANTDWKYFLTNLRIVDSYEDLIEFFNEGFIVNSDTLLIRDMTLRQVLVPSQKTIAVKTLGPAKIIRGPTLVGQTETTEFSQRVTLLSELIELNDIELSCETTKTYFNQDSSNLNAK